MTQSELADVLRVAGGERVSAWERGVNQPDVRLVPVLAEVLGADPAALIGQRPPSLAGSRDTGAGEGGDLAGDGMPGLASKLNFLFATVPRAAHSSQLHTNETAAAALDAFGSG